MFSLSRLAWNSLKFYRTQHLVLAFAVSFSVAVVVGALLVGDSIRGSLRTISLNRLGSVESALTPGFFFHQEISDDTECVPMISLLGAAEKSQDGEKRKAGGVLVYGVDTRFGGMWEENAEVFSEIGPREILLNETLAERLRAQPGDTLLVRISTETDIPAESVLGEKEDTILTLRVTVKGVIPSRGAGNFTLRPAQQTPAAAYVSLPWLQRMMKKEGCVNMLLSRKKAGEMNETLNAVLADAGLKYEVLGGEAAAEKYGNITSRRMIIPAAIEAALRNTPGAKHAGTRMTPILVSLANEIRRDTESIPYSILAATDLYGMDALAADEIALNAWAAENLGASVGDRVRVTYFSPESHGGVMTEVSMEFRVARIVPMTFPWTDAEWTPRIAGITDQLKMGDWTAPFPFHPERIRSEDETYWEEYQAVPKGFVSLTAGRKLWGSRFGEATSVRIYASENVEEIFADEKMWTPTAEEMGMTFTPVRENMLEASGGATPFDALFLALSFFVILAAVMLIALLFGLFVDARREQIGLLFALGWREKRVRTLLLREGMFVAAAGTAAGVVLGVLYAQGVLWALVTVWSGAVNTRNLAFYGTWRSVILGAACGGGIAVAVMAYSVRAMRFFSPKELTHGDFKKSRGWSAAQSADRMEADNRVPPDSGIALRSIPCSLNRVASRKFLAGIGVFLTLLTAAQMTAVLWQPAQDDLALAGIFFGCGTLLLAAQLFLLAAFWKKDFRRGTQNSRTRFRMETLAGRNLRRRPARSLLTVGLLAVTTFLILAIGAFRMDPAGENRSLDDFQGGVNFLVETDIPVTVSPAVAEDRRRLGFSPAENEVLNALPIYAFRMREGDNATCANLYRPQEPPILGVPAEFGVRSRFSWANRGAAGKEESPWTLLERELPPDADGVRQFPVIVDQNTAMYMLRFYRGPGDSLVVTNLAGEKIRLTVVAVLGNSIFQGVFLASEPLLLKYFPEVEGFRMLAVMEPADAETAKILDSHLGDFGARVETASARTSRLLTVQNTYLSAFQALTALGLILGTFGLVAVQMRNMLERRGEFALMRAVGFSRGKLLGLCLQENFILLAYGFLIGTLAAVCVALPPMLQGKAAFPLPLFAAFAGASVLIVLGTGGILGGYYFGKSFLKDLKRE